MLEHPLRFTGQVSAAQHSIILLQRCRFPVPDN
jgi:hypothetical protein